MTDAAPRVPMGPPQRCTYCRSGVELVSADVVYPNRPELADRKIWRCTSCDAYVGCHKRGARVIGRGGVQILSDGTLPMGSLANHDLRAARIETHRMFDELWRPPARMSRSDAYAWMARTLSIATEEAHVASLTYDECVKVMLAVEDLVRPAGEKPELKGAAHWLTQAEIDFNVEPDGHFAVKAGGDVIDYWPETQTWSVRGELLADESTGLHELILFCRLRH